MKSYWIHEVKFKGYNQTHYYVAPILDLLNMCQR